MSGSKENKQEALQKENEYKVTWKGWVSLAFLIISFSGLVAHQDNFLKAFDLMNLMGQFGHADGAKIAMQGTGGFGAREGFAFALTMVPVTMLAQGLIETCEHLGALKLPASFSSHSSVSSWEFLRSRTCLHIQFYQLRYRRFHDKEPF